MVSECCCKSIRTLSLVVLLIFCAPPIFASGMDLTGRLDSLFAAIPSATFKWMTLKGVSKRGALRIPVNLDGTKGWFQLDTGLDVTLVYGNIATDRGWETYDGMCHVPNFKIGEMDLGSVWIRTRDKANKHGTLIGSLGLDLLVGYLVIIDYPGQRMALLKNGEAPLWLWQHTTWTPARLRDAKFFLNVILGDESVNDLVFDTGSSAFDIIVDQDDWIQLTGYKKPDAAPIKKRVNSWGKKITAVGAPAKGPLTIGSAHIAGPKVFYLKEQPNAFSSWPFPARGIVGNAPFWDRIVIMDLGIRPRFGLLE